MRILLFRLPFTPPSPQWGEGKGEGEDYLHYMVTPIFSQVVALYPGFAQSISWRTPQTWNQ